MYDHLKSLADEVIKKFVSAGKLSGISIEELTGELMAYLEKEVSKLSDKDDHEIKLKVLANRFCSNKTDLNLINKRSPAIFEKYKAILVERVSAFAKRDQRQFHWLMEKLHGQLIFKLAEGKFDSFRGDASFGGYLRQAVNNILINEVDKWSRRPLQTEINEPVLNLSRSGKGMESYAEQFYPLLLMEFQDKFERTLFEFSIRVKARQIFTPKEVLSLFPHCSEALSEQIIDIFGQSYAEIPAEAKLWPALQYFLLELSGKKQSTRTIKDWIKTHRNNILVGMFAPKGIHLPIPPKGAHEKAIDEFFEEIIYHYYQNPAR